MKCDYNTIKQKNSLDGEKLGISWYTCKLELNNC